MDATTVDFYTQKMVVWGNPGVEKCLVDSLKAGALVAGSTDTVPGLFADVTERGFTSLNNLKARTQKPYLIIIDSPTKVALFAHVPTLPEFARKLMAACWPGPLTIIVKARPELPAWMVGADGTVAVRVPDHTGVLALLKHFDGLFSTSANYTGQPTPATLKEMDVRILTAVQYVVADAVGQEQMLPSTIVDCTGQTMRVVRAGAYAIHDLEKVVQK